MSVAQGRQLQPGWFGVGPVDAEAEPHGIGEVDAAARPGGLHEPLALCLFEGVGVRSRWAAAVSHLVDSLGNLEVDVGAAGALLIVFGIG